MLIAGFVFLNSLVFLFIYINYVILCHFQPSDKGGVDEEDLKQVPKWRAKGIGEVVLDAEPADSRPASVAPETARVDGSPLPPPADAGDAEEGLLNI